MIDICLFEGKPLELTPRTIDAAWRNYFGTSHGFAQEPERRTPTGELRPNGHERRNTAELVNADPLHI